MFLELLYIYSLVHENSTLSQQNHYLTKLSGDDDEDGELGVANGDAGSIIEIVNIGPVIKLIAISEIEATIDAVSHELSKLRTRRVSAGGGLWLAMGLFLGALDNPIMQDEMNG
ncbi:hypothetical protein L2E82_22689 [Cichorium intybus]|uniref:Uncharacterized protein n=1 Tax=Cichorium intybus TaxID=13427 RepID=A0ACB9DXY3_CICIN|nr:hypothetical protein L2E82_22689 [Cichorium intybus]